MNKVAKLSISELKKVGMTPYFYLATLLAVLIGVAIGIEGLQSQSFGIKHVYALFAMVAEYIVLYYGAKSLGDEFTYKTSTIIFTKKVSRLKIIMSKLLTLAQLGFLLGVLSSSVAITFSILAQGTGNLQPMLVEGAYNVVVYVLFSLLIGSSSILATLITMNTTTSLIITLIAFQFAPPILNMVGQKLPFIEKLLNYIPFYTAINFIELHQMEAPILIGIITGIIAFVGLIAFVTNRKDLV